MPRTQHVLVITLLAFGALSCTNQRSKSALVETASTEEESNSSTSVTNENGGSFHDSSGRAFDNIVRYSCFELIRKGTQIVNRKSYYNTIPIVSGSRFCFSKGNKNNGAPEQICSEPYNKPQGTYSSQSYYYSLYTRSTDGVFNVSAGRFMCPTVQTANDSLKFHPLDSTFALALNKNESFSVPVEAASRIAGGANAISVGCDGTQAFSSTGMIKTCVGWAAPPLPDGSCPMLRKSDGSSLPTYRLRRYVALYPPIYNTDGAMIEELPHATDSILVLDRPVAGSSSGMSGTPSTIAGPKPCPFAFYDDKVTSSAERYLASNSAAWNGGDGRGHNVDGLRFPNVDIPGESCSATLPLVSPDRRTMTLGTVHATNPVYKSMPVRPFRPWTPEYFEDTSFEACAPRSQEHRDPPLHFARTTDRAGRQDVAWCAEVYPTKNHYRPPTQQTPGLETSHTCDGDKCNSRTLQFSGTTAPSWDKFPLLAAEADVEKALKENPTYRCALTHDWSGAKPGRTPAGGCCANVSVKPGSGSEAHLDSGSCEAPSYD